MTAPDYLELAAGCELAASTDALAGNVMAQLALKGAAKAIRELQSSATASEKRVQELEYARDNPPPRHGRGCLCGKCVWDGR